MAGVGNCAAKVLAVASSANITETQEGVKPVKSKRWVMLHISGSPWYCLAFWRGACKESRDEGREWT